MGTFIGKIYRDMGQAWSNGTNLNVATQSAWMSWTKGHVSVRYDIMNLSKNMVRRWMVSVPRGQSLMGENKRDSFIFQRSDKSNYSSSAEGQNNNKK